MDRAGRPILQGEVVPPETRERRLRRLIAGKYRVVSVLGIGGMGEVYLAEHLLTHRQVALKLLGPAAAHASPDAAPRFFAEAAAAAACRHRGVVEVLDAGADSDGTLYLAFERLVGADLEVVFRERCPSPSRMVALALEALGALEAVHRAGYVHRDIKPSNLFLHQPAPGAQPEVKLLDFGIAQPLEAARKSAETDPVIGTAEYMSPEQAASGPLDGRSDLWGMAAVLFRGLTGRPPFVAASLHRLLVKAATQDAPSLTELRPDLPVELIEAVDRALLRDPGRRFASAAAFSAALAACDPVALAAAEPSPGTLVLLPSDTRDAPRSHATSAAHTVRAGAPSLPDDLADAERKRSQGGDDVLQIWLARAFGHAPTLVIRDRVA
jgi:serine/threonine protein kinase